MEDQGRGDRDTQYPVDVGATPAIGVLAEDSAQWVSPIETPRVEALPLSGSGLVGREQELSNIRTYLVDRRMRLLTLTGAGGIGKTRLAVEAARELQANFADGAVIVDLAAYREPLFVVSAIASAIGTRHAGSRSLLDAVKRQLQRMRLLLVLDNFEQVLAAAPLVADLLANCASLTILITSRAPLRLSWECEFPVGPLRTPASEIGHEPGSLADVSFGSSPG